MELFYTGEGDLVGGSISTYLLEHVRVTKQLPGERNFHIFYELLEGDDDVWMDGWMDYLKVMMMYRGRDGWISG